MNCTNYYYYYKKTSYQKNNQLLTMKPNININNYHTFFSAKTFLKQKDNNQQNIFKNYNKNVFVDSNNNPKHNLLSNRSYVSDLSPKQKQNKFNCQYDRIQEINNQYSENSSVDQSLKINEVMQMDSRKQIGLILSQYINKSNIQIQSNVTNFKDQVDNTPLLNQFNFLQQKQFKNKQQQQNNFGVIQDKEKDKKKDKIIQQLKTESFTKNNNQEAQTLLKNAEIQYKLELQSLKKQYELKLEKQSESYQLQIWRLKEDISTMNAQIKNTKINVNFIKFEQTPTCTICSNGQIIKSLQKILENLSKDHDGCLTEKRNFTLKYTQMERQLQELKQTVQSQKSEIESLKSQILTNQTKNNYEHNNNFSISVNQQNNINTKNDLFTDRSNLQGTTNIKKQKLKEHKHMLNLNNLSYRQNSPIKNKFSSHRENDNSQYKNKKYYMDILSMRKKQQPQRRMLNIQIQQDSNNLKNGDTFRSNSIRDKSYHYHG